MSVDAVGRVRTMDSRRLLMLRSASQLLDHRIGGGPEAAVRWLLAVQAQDKSAWRLALRARVDGISAADVDTALTEKRSLVVAWLNRGTLHLVGSEDYAWMHALTAPTYATANARRLAQEGLPPDDADRGVACIERCLAAEGPLSRPELRDRLDAAGTRTEGQALVHLLFAAVGRGVAVMGPMRAGEHAFAHAREWLGAPATPLTGEARDRALAELARRYLNGHGPATDGDLGRWAGLPLRDARLGLRLIAGELVEFDHGLVDLANRRPAPAEGAYLPVRLLPAFDPCLLGWKQREPFLRRMDEPLAIPVGGGVFRPILTVDGVAAATWSVRRGPARLAIAINSFNSIDEDAMAEVRAEAADVARFEGRALTGSSAL